MARTIHHVSSTSDSASDSDSDKENDVVITKPEQQNEMSVS